MEDSQSRDIDADTDVPITLEYYPAPLHWYWELFPRPDAEAEIVTLDWVAELSIQILNVCKQSGDSTLMGPTLHWAHRFVITQSEKGNWPRELNLKTGQVLDERPTVHPARFLNALGEFLNSFEFESAVRRAFPDGIG